PGGPRPAPGRGAGGRGGGPRARGLRGPPPPGARAARVRALAAHRADWLQLGFRLGRDDVVVDDRRSASGHGRPDGACVDAVRLVARTEGILIDPTYLAKVVLTCRDLADDGRIRADRPAVLWHTGGAVAGLPHTESLGR